MEEKKKIKISLGMAILITIFKYIANTYWPEHEYEISALEFHIAEYNGKCVISYCE